MGKQKSRKKEILKYVAVICSSLVLVICISEAYLKVCLMQRETYEFCSAVNIGEEVVSTTPAFLVPAYMCEEGETEVRNATGYEIFLFTHENGFQRIGQEEFTMKITPVCIFVIEPETKKLFNAGGNFTIKNGKGEEVKYHVMGFKESVIVNCKEIFP